jgi:hypothetical protein
MRCVRNAGAALALAAALAACATGYKTEGGIGIWRGGFSETQLAPDMYVVTFKGNAKTDMERSTDFTLLRSAELTLGAGYQYFAIVDAKERVRTVAGSSGSTSTYSHATVSGNNVSGWSQSSGGGSYVHQLPSASNTIVMLHEKPADAVVYDAAFITESLRKKYGLKD